MEAYMTTIAEIAIENGKLTIFGSNMGYLGPVIQDYQPFDSEPEAIAEAKARLTAQGIQFESEICRPNITRMTMTTSKRRTA